MSDGIYRPLFVMVEAVEAEAKRLLDEREKRAVTPAPLSAPSLFDTMNYDELYAQPCALELGHA